MVPVTPEHQELTAADLSHIGHGRVDQVGVFNNFRMYAYAERGYALLPQEKHRVVSGMDLDARTHFGVPVHPGISMIKFVDCGIIDDNCTVIFFYKGQTVTAYINKEKLDDISNIVVRIYKKLEGYDISSRTNSR